MEFIKKNVIILLIIAGAALYFFYYKNKGVKSLKSDDGGLINNLVNKVKPCPEQTPCPQPIGCPEPQIIYKDKIIERPCPAPPEPQIIYKDKIVEKPVYRDKIVKVPVEKIVYRDKIVQVPVEKIIYRDRPISTLADARDIHNSAAKEVKASIQTYK